MGNAQATPQRRLRGHPVLGAIMGLLLGLFLDLLLVSTGSVGTWSHTLMVPAPLFMIVGIALGLLAPFDRGSIRRRYERDRAKQASGRPEGAQ